LYHERLAELEKEATAISTGKHPNYSLAMSEIDRRRKKQMEQVSEWRRHKNIDIHRQVQSSLRSAHATFLVRPHQLQAVGWIAEGEFFKRIVPLTLIDYLQAKRAELRRSVMDSIMNQKQKLTDEMMLFDSTGTSILKSLAFVCILGKQIGLNSDVLPFPST
jgi:Sds3-like